MALDLEQVMEGVQLELGQLVVLQNLQKVNFWEALESGSEMVKLCHDLQDFVHFD